MSYGGIFDYDAKSERLRTVNASLEDPSVWNDPKKAQELGKEKKALDGVVVTITNLTSELADNLELFEMSKEEGDDDGLLTIETETAKLTSLVAEAAPEERRGEALGYQQSAGALARIVGPVAAGAIFDGIGVGAPYILGGALVLLAVILVARGARVATSVA